MIRYSNDSCGGLLKLFTLRGSVFVPAFIAAFPPTVLAAALKYASMNYVGFEVPEVGEISKSGAWSGFSFLVGFLIVFRTSQAYERFWEGCTTATLMRARWFSACSSLIAFCKDSSAPLRDVERFQGTLIRLFSMLHAASLAAVEDANLDEHHADSVEAYKFELIDAQGIDVDSLITMKDETHKVELIFQWIQALVVENQKNGVLSISPPILARPFQEMGEGICAFHDALKVSETPFPFPYAQTCDLLLLVHGSLVGFVVYPWVTHPAWAAILTFVQVFILWALDFIAVELENPYGLDANDLDGRWEQQRLNERLKMLVRASTARTPQLSDSSVSFDDWEQVRKSFQEIWTSDELEAEPGLKSAVVRFSQSILPTRMSLAPSSVEGGNRQSLASSRSSTAGPPTLLKSRTCRFSVSVDNTHLEGGGKLSIPRSGRRCSTTETPSVVSSSCEDRQAQYDGETWARSPRVGSITETLSGVSAEKEEEDVWMEKEDVDMFPPSPDALSEVVPANSGGTPPASEKMPPMPRETSRGPSGTTAYV
mmetsp:Transcript_27758/g.61276  ORF Transcript_27758/g.61276 Transcript_27758/m.61276 type:complete len:540 (+) Transcript_27758:49-1668(+)